MQLSGSEESTSSSDPMTTLQSFMEVQSWAPLPSRQEYDFIAASQRDVVALVQGSTVTVMHIDNFAPGDAGLVQLSHDKGVNVQAVRLLTHSKVGRLSVARYRWATQED
jgi:hypothetical protein